LLQRRLNLGILAHVDAGKTTLTERLLYAAGAIDRLGSVDAGTTQTDTLALERQRGITIRSAVASFAVDDVTVNLIDTPGHPDFIAEVERVLSVLDGAVLVVSAVEGVQAQTRLLMRALQRLRVPTLVFVNKIDRPSAAEARVLRELGERLTPAVIAAGATCDLGTPSASFRAYRESDTRHVESLAVALAERDDALLSDYVADAATLTYRRLRDELARQTRRALVHPIFFGSARTGAGVAEVIAAAVELLPPAECDPDAPPSGSVFKIERGAAGEKVAYVRMFAGTVRVRDRLRLRDGDEHKVTALSVFDRGGAVQRSSVSAGEIAKLSGLAVVRVGDAVGVPRPSAFARVFAPPTLEAAIVPRDVARRGALRDALLQLAEQDPLIDVRQDDERHELFVSLYGEVQKEVLEATLALDYGIAVDFRETTTICVERPRGSGVALEALGAPTNPFQATLGLRIDPAPPASGVHISLDVEVRSVPLYVYKAVDEFVAAMNVYVCDTLTEGRHGWRVTDCAVTVTDCGYAAPSTTAADFRKLTPLVLARALHEAGTDVCEPVHRFRLDGPVDGLQATVRLLAQLRIDAQSSSVTDAGFVVEGEIAAARAHELQRHVRGLTHGEGVLELEFDRYEPVRGGDVPTRRRTRPDPLNREQYLLHVARRVAGRRSAAS
jgi:ribosomal protection tetracycline resistance protein